jgi:TetR/AcrR family acrAB operon transcriptional repressor
MERAVTLRGEKLTITVSTAALGLHVMVTGLIQSWLLDQQGFDLLEVGRQTIDAYLAGLGLRPRQA